MVIMIVITTYFRKDKLDPKRRGAPQLDEAEFRGNTRANVRVTIIHDSSGDRSYVVIDVGKRRVTVAPAKTSFKNCSRKTSQKARVAQRTGVPALRLITY